ncbi:MAG TPA: hypothetical protein VGW38_28025 [Chloroflexota bacterium]|nr:hypothetical protein [Chloroflexota bacterium]
MGAQLTTDAGKKPPGAVHSHLQLSFGSVVIRTLPRKGAPGLRLWVVRVWEVDAPAGADPLEWVLVTTIPVRTLEQAQEKVEWYTTRWLCEDYHECLRTRCAIERRDLEAARTERLASVLALSTVELTRFGGSPALLVKWRGAAGGSRE